MGNPILAHVVRGYVLRGRGRARAENEARCIAAFRGAGWTTPEIHSRPGPDATVFRWVTGRSAAELIAKTPGAEERAALVRELAAEIARRQEQALARGDRFLLHPHPRLTHVLVGEDGARTYLDFEGIVNPHRPVAELAALETESFLAYIARSRHTREDSVLRAALDGLGESALARWRAAGSGPFWFLSGTARHRRERLARVASLLAGG
jgi:hypothetical protein